MKIAIDIRSASSAYGTGIGSYTKSFLTALHKLNTPHIYYLFTLPTEVDLILPENFISIKCPVLKKEARTFTTNVLNQLKPDVYFLPQNGMYFPFEKTCRWVATIHDLIPFIMPEMVRWGYFDHFTQEIPPLVNLADRIITVSRSTSWDLQRLFEVPSEKIRVIPSGPDEMYKRLPHAKCTEELKTRYPLLRFPFLLYVGGLNPRKNVPFLLYAMRMTARYLPRPYQLVIAGSDEYRLQQLKMLTEALEITDYVYFPGHIPDIDLPYFYNTASAFLYPTLYEGFGLPPLEAMACGTPVLVSDCSSLPEVVGKAGKKFSPHDFPEFQKKLREILTDRSCACKMREEGLKTANRFRWNRLAKKILDALTEWN